MPPKISGTYVTGDLRRKQIEKRVAGGERRRQNADGIALALRIEARLHRREIHPPLCRGVLHRLPQRRLSRRDLRIVGERLLDEFIDLRRPEQGPPIPRHVLLLEEPLRSSARDLRRGRRGREGLDRIAIDLRCWRAMKIGPDAGGQSRCANRRESARRLIRPPSGPARPAFPVRSRISR